MRILLLTFLCLTLAGKSGTVVEVQPVKEIGEQKILGTKKYVPTDTEKEYFERLPEGGHFTGGMIRPYKIQGHKGEYVSWFGIVREIKGKPKRARSLLVEHKYFDGLTDLHLQVVSFNGSGDFVAKLKKSPEKIPHLSLVRIYGKVTSEKKGRPTIKAEYVRVWPWKTFTFMPYGIDASNPVWRKLSKVDGGKKIYSSRPDEQYYIDRLGEPKE